MKYTAIKLSCFGYWIWFLTEKIKEDNDTFIGIDGWGNMGALTSVEVNDHLVEGRIESESAQYQ